MTRFHLASSMRLPSFALLTALAVNLTGCIIDKDLGDTPGTSSSTSTTATTTATDSGSTGTTDPTGGAPALCPDNPKTTCTFAFNCSTDFPCGGLQDLFDADGCPRLHCDADEPCPAGEVCYQSGVWGECNASGVFCEDEGEKCNCNVTLDCHEVSYCVPAELGPPTDCGAITDASACLAADCSDASTVVPVTLAGDSCVCGEPETACVWFEGNNPGVSDSAAAFYRKSTQEVVVFPLGWVDPPHGWESCADGQAPPACACASDCIAP